MLPGEAVVRHGADGCSPWLEFEPRIAQQSLIRADGGMGSLMSDIEGTTGLVHLGFGST